MISSRKRGLWRSFKFIPRQTPPSRANLPLSGRGRFADNSSGIVVAGRRRTAGSKWPDVQEGIALGVCTSEAGRRRRYESSKDLLFSANRPPEIRTLPSRTWTVVALLVGADARSPGKASVVKPLVIQAAHGQIDQN